MKAIVGHERWSVDTEGNVFGPKGKLKITKSKRGFAMTNVNKRTKNVHILVAKAYLENPKNWEHVVHINGNKLDNRAENLRWVSLSERRKYIEVYKQYESRFDEHTENQQKQIVALHRSKPKYTIPYLSKLIGSEEHIIERYIMKYKGRKV